MDSIMALANLATPMAIRVAATLGLGELHGTAAELAAECGASPSALRRVLDHLVTVGVFARDGDSYRPTPLGEQLTEFRPLLDIERAGGRSELAFVELLEAVRTGEPAYPKRYGRSFWADLAANPSLRSSFDDQMNWRFRTHAPQIAARFGWSRFPFVLDVGGGDGTLLAAILREHPSVRGQVLDVSVSTDRLSEFGDRASVVEGSFFDPLPAGADAYVLSDILHDWDDDSARRILSGCRAAASPGGTVVVIEAILGAGTGTAVDLWMLVCLGGRERTVEELAALGAECGLELRWSGPVSEGRTALEFGVAG